MRIHEDRVTQLRNLPLPRDVDELRRALGAFAYVQRWLPGMSEVAKPLYMVLRYFDISPDLDRSLNSDSIPF